MDIQHYKQLDIQVVHILPRHELLPEYFKMKSCFFISYSAQRALTSLSCFAYNKVMERNRGVHLQKATVINVKYKPEVERNKKVEHLGRNQEY